MFSKCIDLTRIFNRNGQSANILVGAAHRLLIRLTILIKTDIQAFDLVIFTAYDLFNSYKFYSLLSFPVAFKLEVKHYFRQLAGSENGVRGVPSFKSRRFLALSH